MWEGVRGSLEEMNDKDAGNGKDANPTLIYEILKEMEKGGTV